MHNGTNNGAVIGVVLPDEATVRTLLEITRDPSQALKLAPEVIAHLAALCGAAHGTLLAAAALRTNRTPAVSTEVEPGELLTAKQMAERLNVTESWIRSEARAGRIPKVVVGRYVRFDPTAVTRALKGRQP